MQQPIDLDNFCIITWQEDSITLWLASFKLSANKSDIGTYTFKHSSDPTRWFMVYVLGQGHYKRAPRNVTHAEQSALLSVVEYFEQNTDPDNTPHDLYIVPEMSRWNTATEQERI